jgi:2-C-methyl-D-erythritol 4-phosphate cytidylyltransferase
MSRFAVIVPAAGKSTRFGDPKQKKIYADLAGRAVWLHAVEPFVNREDVTQIIMAIAPEDRELFERRYRASVAFMNIHVVDGGAERYDTVARALEHVDESCDYVAIHDAARPCLCSELIDAVFAAGRAHGAALLAIPVADTIKRVGADRLTGETLPRECLYCAQTPQVFRKSLLIRAYAERFRLGAKATDDCQLVEAIGNPCTVVDGSPLNIKVTTQEDLKMAAAVLPLLEKTPKRETSCHPFSDESPSWTSLPKLKPSDVFGS